MRKAAVAKKYARAFIAIGREYNAYEKYGIELRGIEGLFDSNPLLYKVLLNPTLKMEAKLDLTETLASDAGAGEAVKKFLAFLVEKRDILLLREIADVYLRMEDELKNRVSVLASAPFPLGKEEIKMIKDSLDRATKKDAVVKFVKDPSLIGGLVLKIENKILDGSIKTQLDKLKEKLLQA